jgi:hypothetical protein
LKHDGVVVSAELIGRGESCFETGRLKGLDERLGDGVVDLAASDPKAILTSTVGNGVAGAVISWGRVPTTVGNTQSPTATPAAGNALQECWALSHGASGLMRARMKPW